MEDCISSTIYKSSWQECLTSEIPEIPHAVINGKQFINTVYIASNNAI